MRVPRKFIPVALACAAGLAVSLPLVGAAVPTGAVLPDLVADPPAFPVIQQYTYPDGTQALLLRFDGYVHNIGPGPLEIRGTNRVGPEYTTVRQYVQTPSGMQATDPPTAGKYPRIIYETQDGHNHFHLQKLARYSLWNQARTAEVAPGQKAGFCLEDSQRRETNGPSSAVYINVDFCHQGDPNAASLTGGVSAGWRDRYGASLAFQWVDISDVQPGVYRLAAEIDTENVLQEASETNNTVAFAAADSIVAGYRALAVNAGTVPAAQASTITLNSQTFGTPGARRFRIATLPAAGVLRSGTTVLAVGSVLTGNTVTYTPNSGSSGPDTFTYTAFDSTSLFPRNPAAASVSLTVGTAPAETSVAISGAPATLNKGTSAQLAATVTNGPPGVTWSVNGVDGGNATVGTISTSGLYVAPAAVPGTNPVTIRARSTTTPSAFDEAQITITDPGPPDPAPNPGTNYVANGSFETDLSGWSAWQASLTRVSLPDAPLGVQVARVARTSGTSFTMDDTPTSVTNAAAGTTYTGSAFVKSANAASNGAPVRIYLRERTAAGAVVRTINGTPVNLTDTFQKISAQVAPQAAGNQIEIYLGQTAAVAGSAFYIDAISLTNGQGGNLSPTASFGADTLNPTVGQAVHFADHSTDEDGSIAARAWDLDGDGAFDDSTAENPTWTYTAPGVVNVRLQVTDNLGTAAVATRQVTVTSSTPVNQPPTAAFAVSSTTPQTGQTVTFTDQSTDSDGTITGREWDLDGDGFDDGTGATASRVYTVVGDVQVRLRVTDDDNAQTTATRTISVTTTPPTTTNLIANGSFETNLSGWSSWQGSLAREQIADAPAGQWVAKVTRSSGTAFTMDDSPTTVLSTAATPYHGSVKVKAATASAVGKPFELFFRERNASGTVLRNFAGPTVTLSNTFQTATADLTPLAAGNQLEVYFSVKQAVAGMAVYMDDGQLRTG